jgi:DNA-binding NarL/FixJ family response regulator
MNSITVLLSEDHMILRVASRALLADEPDIQIVGEAANGHQAVELCLQLQPHIVVMDIRMPMLNGLEATRQILRTLPATKILILSESSDPLHLDELMKLNIAGYLLKQSEAELLPGAIRAAHNGEGCFSPAIARHLERQAGRHAEQIHPGAPILPHANPRCFSSSRKATPTNRFQRSWGSA